MGDSPQRRQRIKELYWQLIDVLGGYCEECVVGEDLEIDHINGRSWSPKELNWNKRIKKYWEEYRAGIPLRVLCRSCNGSDGWKRSRKKKSVA